jgi:hypothetical protein
MLAIAAILTLSSGDVLTRAVELWNQSCAAPSGFGLCAKLVSAPSLPADHALKLSGIDFECRVEDSRAFVSTRQRQSRDSRANQAIRMLERTVSTRLRDQDPAQWAVVRIIQGDHLFEELLAIATRPPIQFVKILTLLPEHDPRLERALEQVHNDRERQNAPASRSLKSRVQELLARSNEVRAIYDDVRQHGSRQAAIVALMRLGQLDADLEQAISTSSTEQNCATKANWATWKNAYVEPRDGLFADRAKRELLFCQEEAKSLMLVEQIAACESELNRIAPDEYPIPVEIVREPRP